MKIHAFANNPITKSMRIGCFISSHSKSSNKKVYFIQNQNGEKIGKFKITSGIIYDLKLKNRFRRTKEGVCALFAIKKFVEDYARKNGINCLFFDALEENPNNVVRLYKKFATPLHELCPHFMLPVNSKGRRQILSRQYPVSDEFGEDKFTINNAKYIITNSRPVELIHKPDKTKFLIL